MAVGIPTQLSHNKPSFDLLKEFNSILVTAERVARENRILMAAGNINDSIISDVWKFFANSENRIDEIRRTPDFQDEYARYRSLSFFFNCTDDVNAAQDKIINLPINHKFKTNHRIDFKLVQGALTGGLSENTNYFVRTVDAAAGTITLTDSEDGVSDINLTNGTGTAEMILNIKPDLAALRTAIDAALDEIEANLVQRAYTYDRPNVDFTYSTRSSGETSSLQTMLSNIEALIDVVAA